MTTGRPTVRDEARVEPMLWAAWLAGPLAWFVHLSASYALVPWVCRSGHVAVLHLLTAAMLVVTVAGVLAAWSSVRAAPRVTSDRALAASPRRFIAITAVGLGLLFSALIIMEGMPGVLLDACR